MQTGVTKVNKKILVVDDSATVRQSVSMALDRGGYLNLQAVDGQDALEKLSSESFGMIITDINMPNLDGFGLIQQARKMEKTRFIPIIVLTTESSDEIKSRGKAAGATGWIVKPFKAELLLKVVKMTLG